MYTIFMLLKYWNWIAEIQFKINYNYCFIFAVAYLQKKRK